MTRGHTRWRGSSIEVRVHAGRGRYVTETVPWQGGKKKTQDKANTVLTRLLGEVDGGKHGGPTDSFAVLAEAWWKHKRKGWSPSTAAGYRSRLDFRILPHLGHYKVGQIKPGILVAWLDEHAGDSQSSKFKSFLIVRAILEHGRRLDWIARNPAADLTVTVPPPNVHAPPPEMVAAALTSIAETNPDMLVFFHLAAASGARRGELLGVKWDDLDGNVLTIRRSVVKDEKGSVHVRPYPKGKRPRAIALDANTVAILDAHRERCQAVADALEVKLGGFVFADDPRGKTPWRPDRPTQAWTRLRARLKWNDEEEHVVLHGLRHFHVTQLLAAGHTVVDVAARAGHSNPAVTHRIYAHAIAGRDAELAKTMGEVLG